MYYAFSDIWKPTILGNNIGREAFCSLILTGIIAFLG